MTTLQRGAIAAVLLLLHGTTEVARTNEPSVSPVVTDFDQPFSYCYLAFEKGPAVADGVAHIVGRTGKGGVGVLAKMDLGKYADYTPAIWARTGPGHRSREIKVFFASGKARRTFVYDLRNVGQDRFVRVLPQHGLALSPDAGEETDPVFDPARIDVFQIQGDWTDDAVDLFVDKITLVAPTSEMGDQRRAYAEELRRRAERKQREEQRRRERIEKLLTGAPHETDGPDVRHVAAVGNHTIALTIEAQEISPRKQTPYLARPGDEIRAGKKGENTTVLSWEKGKIVDAPKGRFVLRDTKGNKKFEELGPLVVNHDLIAPGPVCRGTAMTTETLDQPRAYRIASMDDPAFAQGPEPTAVFVKSKPTGQAPSGIPVRFYVYLQLHAPLKENARYTISLIGVNTRQKSVTYKHDPRNVRSEAVHVTQIGFRPSDPHKRAYLSLWRGTGGATRYDNVERFEILDAVTSETVYRGTVRLGFPADEKESIRGGKNYTQTNVYYLDFHDFRRPGTFRVFVPGVGVSYPFEIADDVWARAFALSMHGFLSHRSGIALGPPFTDYVRPRPMHPSDGFTVFDLDVTFWTGEADAVHRSLRRLLGPELDAAKVRTVPSAWGGYMDAGDWDRRSQHLQATWTHLELLDLFPEHFARLKLALPADEARDGLPDILNEALWNLDFYRRLQRPSGGVGGGAESTSHPVPGEASWQESLLVGTFAPDPETSLRYAACAATAARLIEEYDAGRAAGYGESARRAWEWALANEAQTIEAESRTPQSRGGAKPDKLREAVRDMRALAAVTLYRLTGQAEYHEAFRKSSALARAGDDPGRQLHSVFAYARLPKGRADADLQRKAVAWFEQAADDSLKFARGNAFGITSRVAMLPLIGYVGYYSVPETSIGAVLPRAHYLTGKEEYLRGAVAAAQFSAGANPMNMTFTTGLGHRYPRHPLHVDSQHAGIEPPAGVTVYGINDPAQTGGHLDWAHTWFLRNTMRPDSRTWPAAEFYVDLGNWPPMNEYTVHQTFGPVSFYWGYLAARAAERYGF
ncbi:MAG: glycoside hydrolase family 9 protein [Sedimentisphaerales bacterium]|nr:glycoside hydrolase family 9 protein [Sedimentisphaerales bacterium]